MPTWTLYTPSADVGTLGMVFNAVAMLSQQTALIWGFTLMATVWFSLKGVAKAPSEGASSAIRDGMGGPVVALILAMLLTTPQARCTVQIESTRNGTVTVVDNVPVLIAIVPVTGSLISSEASSLVRTVFRSTNADYDTMSSSGNGFIDPMKRLLAARSAILRLGSLNSEIQSVVAACLGGDAGTDYAAVNNLVVKAGNYPPAQAGTILPINGVSQTAIGVLLGQASLNTGALVYDLSPTAPQILNCPAAAQVVVNDIDAALASVDFARVVQGGVNGMDEADAGADQSLTQLGSQYTALRRWSTVTGNLAGGQQQANAELINLLFAETLATSLNCLKASDSDRALCESSMVQATEVERSNLQSAAAAAPAVAYIGAFARFMLALVIALGPIIVMLAMFAGLGAGKAVTSLAHIILWPMLAIDVGAEIVNGLMLHQFSGFMAALSQQGFLSPLTVYGLYHELSLQIGVASNIMASLPVIMGTLFGFSEASALKGSESAGAPRGEETARTMAPAATDSSPLVRQSAPVAVTQGVGFHIVKPEGALEAASLRSTVGTVARDAVHSLSEADTRQKTVSEGKSLMADWQNAFQSGKYDRFGLSHEQGEALRKHYEQSLRVNSHADTSVAADTSKNNVNSSKVGGTAGASLGMGGPKGPFSASVGLNGSTQTSATDTKNMTERGSESDSTDRAHALSEALNSDVANRMSQSIGKDKSTTFRKAQTAARKFDELVSRGHSLSDTFSDTLKDGSSLVTAHAAIGTSQLAYQSDTNLDYQRFQADRGFRRDQDKSTHKYLAMAEKDMASDVGATEAVQGNPKARAAVMRTRAAVMQFNDQSAPEQERVEALRFLTDSALAMTHMSVTPTRLGELGRPGEQIEDPKDRTQAGALLPKDKPLPVKGKAPARKPSGGSKGGSPHPAHPSQTSLPGLGPTTLDPSKIDAMADSVRARARDHIEDAEASDLGQRGPGTLIRTGKNVVDNFKDTVRPVEQRSRVRFGKAEPKQAADKDADDGQPMPPLEGP